MPFDYYRGAIRGLPRTVYTLAEMDDLCAEELTCNALEALGNAGDLCSGKAYLVTDYNRGTLGAAQILAFAATENNVAWDCYVQTTFDDSAWEGRWDPDTHRIVQLRDNRGNFVSSDNGDEIEAFPWGNALVTGNQFWDVDLNYTGGTLRDNTGTAACRIDISGGTFSENIIGTSAFALIAGGSVTDCEIQASSYLEVDAMTIRNTRIDGDSNVYTNGGTGTIDRCYVTGLSAIEARGTIGLDLDDVRLFDTGRLIATGATGGVLVHDSDIGSSGYMQITGGAKLDARRSSVRRAFFRALAGTLTVVDTHADSYSWVDHRSTGSNTIRYSKLHSYGRVHFNDTCTGNRVDYSTSSELGLIRFRGTSTDGIIGRSHASTQGYFDIVNSNDNLIRYTRVGEIGYVIINGANGSQVQYTNLDGYGRMLLQSGFSGRVLGTEISGTAYVRITGGASDLRYATFDSYFYYYLNNNAAPKQGLNGSGRQTYTEPNPGSTVTAPGVRNW